ncbi:MAG: peroxidase [Actinobacteria bacterium]|nr:MAG: peroxidase [Actinomycetota bacterium]
MRRILLAAIALVSLCAPSSAASQSGLGVRTLDGSGNNLLRSDLGRAGMPYLRVAAPNYAEGLGSMVGGPSPRYVSNRIFNDVGQNLFSENDVSQWGWAWGQFLDHDLGLRDERPAENVSIPFDKADRLEQFRNDLGVIDFARTPAAPDTGVDSPRQQLNTVSSYIDASNVYGVDKTRLEWLRTGPLDGSMADNRADLLLTRDGYLPRAGARGNVAEAPKMDLFGGQVGRPAEAVVAGDVRANENIALTAIHTLFAREHNRIVAALPRSLPAETKFQIARRVVGAEIQYITYKQFLPALGVRLDPYRSYDPTVNPGLSNEFAVVGYRAHSMIHGEFDVTVKAGTFPQEVLNGFRGAGITVKAAGGNVKLTVPLDLAFGNPALLHTIGVGAILKSLASEREYKNDEQIDNSLRSVLFQVPKPGVANPAACGSPVVNPDCFRGVQDLGAIDIQRGRDHGMPSYNELRRAYGLPPKRSFTAITGEATGRLPLGISIDDPHSLDFVRLRDADGNIVPLGSNNAREDAVVGIRRTTLAARLKAIYGSVDKLDAFVGMLAERHVPGTEFGRLQLAIWKKQFEALRDGDRFFYLDDPALATIKQRYGIDFRRSLAGLIRADTGAALPADAFKAPLETTSASNAALTATPAQCRASRNSHGLLSPTSDRS